LHPPSTPRTLGDTEKNLKPVLDNLGIQAFAEGEDRMSKKEFYKEALVCLLEEFLKTGNGEKIRDYLASNSSLPGPRGNLELAFAFAQVAEDFSTRDLSKMWELALGLISVSADEAPVNDPKEFLPFCGVVTMGAIASAHEEFFQRAFPLLKKLASDSRWRTREGVAMGLQKLIARQGQEVLKELDGWIGKNEWLVMRAVAAGVAEPALLKDEQIAKRALELHEKIFSHILATGERKTDEFRTLRQALGYSLSVVICAAPKEGFEYMRRIAGSYDADILWVIGENLKKNRLVKNFPDEIAAAKKLLP
jgi:hypothetical protein